MKKKFIIVLGLILLGTFLFLACGGGSSNNPYDKLIGHYDNMIKILKENKNDALKANQLLNEYEEKFGQDFNNLYKEIESFSQKNPMQNLELQGKLMEKISELISLSMEMGGEMELLK